VNFWKDILNQAKTAMGVIPELVTGEQLSACAPSLVPNRCKQLAIILNETCHKYKVIRKGTLHELLANLLHESGEFRLKEENMNYRAETLMKVWPKRFPNYDRASLYAKNPKKLANMVYGGRMVNIPGSDDGWLFRGGGFIGLTGRAMYEKYQQYLKDGKSIAEVVDYVRTTDEGAMDSAFWYMTKYKDLIDDADRDDMIGIVKEINGGLIGLKDRQFYLAKVKKHI
jgi:putative chitinase